MVIFTKSTQFCFIFILEYRRYHIINVRNIVIPLCITFLKRLIKIMEFVSYLIKDLRIYLCLFLKINNSRTLENARDSGLFNVAYLGSES